MIKYALTILSALCLVSPTLATESPTWFIQAEHATDLFLEEWKQSEFSHGNTFQEMEFRFSKNKLDKKLRLRDCEEDVNTSIVTLSKSYQHMTIALQCDQPRWKINRPISISILRPIVVLSQAIPRGTVLMKEHLQLKKIDITRLHRGYYADPKSLLGSAAKMSLRMGEIVGPHQVKPRYLIVKKQQVIISAKTKSLSVNVKGVALENGFMGDIISIRNLSSNRVIEGRVSGIGKVTVAL